jgi:glyoxylate reductase
MAKIYVCRNWFPEELSRLSPIHEARIWHDEGNPPRKILLNEVREIEGLLCLGSDTIDAEVIDAAPKLKVISSFSNGTNNINVELATSRNIPVGHPPFVLTETTADLAFGLILTAARRIVEGDAFVRQGKWNKSSHLDLPGMNVNHTNLGIVGMGRIGAQVAKRAKAFNMKVFYHNRNRNFELENLLDVEYVKNLHKMLSLSDFIVLCPPLTEKTRGIIGAAEFAAMKPTAILINVSRGALVDQKALYEALKDRRILRAAIDVTDPEPISLDDPLLTLDNLIISPHIGSAVPEVRRQMMAIAVDNLLLGLRGERIPWIANPAVYGN